MKIVILGAGRVGATVAESLAVEANDITVVDTDPARLRDLEDRLDLGTVVGNASHPSILRKAGIEDADMVLAVTQSDETNLVACKLAASLFNVPTKVARIRSADFLGDPQLFARENFCVDFAICPEQIITEYVSRLIEFPEALQVVEFAGGLVSLVGVRAFHGGPLVGHELQWLRSHVPQVDTRVAAIFRRDRPIIPEGRTVVEAGDEIFFIAASENIRRVMRELRRMDRPVKRVMIAGGGNIGRRLARALERDYEVKIVDTSGGACERLASELHRTLVLHGDATNEELLETENVAEMDVFCALTNDDENNIMASLMAKRMGAHKVIALINRSAYADLVQGTAIDVAISPSQATIGTLLARVRRGDVAAVHRLRRGAAEALELVAHGDPKSSKVVGRKIEEIRLPAGTTIGAVVRRLERPVTHVLEDTLAVERKEQVLIAHHDTVIQAEDHVIVFVTDRKTIPQVERLFQVDARFL
ncbi:MAG TPA: Trk system potassium transporter TrkA [Burkholderiales bacterium]|nr:Trk system potassium transporter TrkA [Burkholderiales bacterium]